MACLRHNFQELQYDLRFCRGKGILYRYQLQGYAKLVGVLKVTIFALLLNGVSSSTSLAQVPPYTAPLPPPRGW